MPVSASIRNKQISALSGQQLVDGLHSLIASARHRLWIASPYLGAWNDVKKILGVTWEKVDVRLLVDKDSGYLSRETLERFEAHRPVRSLAGLHAKLYVIDDAVLLASANLTGCAFRKRYEIGIVISGPAAQSAVTLYEQWWKWSTVIKAEDVVVPKRQHGDEPHGPALPDLWNLPEAPKSPDKASGRFRDYENFLTEYKRFVEDYLACGKRYLPERISVYFETDAFLDFLFQRGDQPSKTVQDRTSSQSVGQGSSTRDR